jgi:hypothetical protein
VLTGVNHGLTRRNVLGNVGELLAWIAWSGDSGGRL